MWKGQSNFSLEKFIAQHRNAFVSMQACAEHIQYQLPNGHSRVGFLLDAIQTSDAGLRAAMASIRTDDGPDGMRNDFEQSAAHLLPYDPVARKHAAGSSKRGSASPKCRLCRTKRPMLQLLEPSREWRVKGGAERWKSETNDAKLGNIGETNDAKLGNIDSLPLVQPLSQVNQ